MKTGALDDTGPRERRRSSRTGALGIGPAHRRRGVLLVLVFVLVSAGVGADATETNTVRDAEAQDDTAPSEDDRAHTYPPGVRGIGQVPETPTWGDDVRVTVRLDVDAAAPQRVTLLYCRVEPTYACALPVAAVADDDGDAWSATIPWDDRFMQPGMRHVGYNITMMWNGADGETSRSRAPTIAHGQPASFPREVDAAYYFYRVEGAPAGGIAAELPASSGIIVFAALMSVAAFRGRGCLETHSETHTSDRSARSVESRSRGQEVGRHGRLHD